jgi:hypothetical protein
MSQYAEQIGFAAGALIATQIAAGIVTPVRFGILQDAQLDFTADMKQLYGQGRYAIALAPGKTKVEIKAKFAGIRGNLFNSLYFGSTTTATRTLFQDNELLIITSHTGTATNGASWLSDQGVFYAATGLPLTKVASATTAGQYSVAAGGVYTFAAGDTAAVTGGIYVSYTYSTTSGIQIPITNVKMGVGPSFSIMLNQPFDGRSATYSFNNCQASKLSLPTKQDDFQINELDFMVAADVAGNIGMINVDI